MLAGAGILGLLAMLCFLGSAVMFILVVVKMFQDAGPVQGIIGLICGLWAFIWGWMNAGRLNLRNIMLIWTALLVLGVILQLIGGGLMIGGLPATPTTP